MLGLGFFVTVLGVGRAPVRQEERCGHRAGLGHPPEPSVAQSSPCFSSTLGPSSPWLLSASAQATHGFSIRAQEPGTLLQTPQDPGRGSALGRYRQRLPRLPGPAERCPRSSCASSHGAPVPALSHTHTPRRARPTLQQPQPSACGSSALLKIIASFLLLLLLLLLSQSPPQPAGGSQRFSLPPQSPKALPFTASVRTVLPRSLPGAGPVLNISLAATSPSLWTGAGSGRERRGEERPPAPRGDSRCSWRKQVCSQPSSHQHLTPGCRCAPSCEAARGSPCSPGRGLWALLAFPCTITGFPGGPRPAGWRLQPRLVLSRAVARPCWRPWLAGARGQDHPQ